MPHTGVQLRLDRGGGVAVFCGEIDIGQGSDTVLAQVVAEVLGIDPLDIRIVYGDTDLTPIDLGSYSSRVTLMMGNAAIQAAERARELLAKAVAERLGAPIERIGFASGRAFDVEDPDRGMSFAEAVVAAEGRFGTIGTVGSLSPCGAVLPAAPSCRAGGARSKASRASMAASRAAVASAAVGVATAPCAADARPGTAARTVDRLARVTVDDRVEVLLDR